MSEDWRTATALLKADLRRRLELEGRTVSRWNALLLLARPGAFCVASYRLSTWLHANRHPLLSKLVDGLQRIVAKSELHVGSRIAGGLVLADARGVGIGRNMIIGTNCTILGASSMTVGGMTRADPDKDFVVLGDHCIVGFGSRILGPVTLADETQIKPNAVVVRSSLVPGAILDGIPARQRGTVARGAVAGWNPLRRHGITIADAPSAVPEGHPRA